MKVTINTTEPQSREIDWSKPMVVESFNNTVVMTTGENSKGFFSGMNITTGEYRTTWSKSIFIPCTTPITVTFENEL